MHHLRRFCSSEQGSGILSSSIFNHLEVPSDCAVSLWVGRHLERMSLTECYFNFRVLGSKLTGAGSIGGSRQPEALRLSIRYNSIHLTLWLSGDSRCRYVEPYNQVGGDEGHANGNPIVDLRFAYCPPAHFNQVFRAGFFSLSGLTALDVKGGDLLDDTTWALLYGCTKLQYLSISMGDQYSGYDYRPLLSGLLDSPALFPDLRVLHLRAAQWHVHHRQCWPPYSDKPFSVLLVRLIDARRAMGRPIEELDFPGVVHVDYDNDLVWLKAMARKQHPKFSWSDLELDYTCDDTCFACIAERGGRQRRVVRGPSTMFQGI
ncbi:uncharacterized protein PHACADRAFT_259049 [Phanerochaete carnosa HHB-10118-sp]|uniref:Uncharacterized protein n=1 Tax=Phanerochaete carnosa (strain HHB-10118-sp) TaxID=650164 RepID=K5VTR8_PHACS|nr:uncharacterized protein PHACADRAFT_259049 [Phanerochaete carnosa HHB-10118-sp]EKM54883.1 hypothetical protein PHACADRAFT_259049 [Phanerochaete carnosa HHB-10118-sp]